MDKIYLKDNYIVAEVGGETNVFPKYYAAYYETSTHFFISNIIGQSYVRTLSIDLTDIPNFYDEAGTTAYTITTLRAFLRSNTGFKSPPGGSGGVSDGNKGDITVTGSGATWTVNALAIDDGKISDVDASKVVENSTARFVTDTDLINLSNLSGTNSGDETTGTIKTKLGAATGTTDGYLTAADWDIFNGKQPVLISGTNIKTINGSSVLGSGNLTVTASAASGTNILILADESDVSGSTNSTVKTYVLAANTYSRIIIESECEFQSGANVLSTCDFAIYVNGTQKRVVENLNSATGAGDFVRSGIAIKYSEAITAGATITLRTQNVSNASWNVCSLRVYGII